MPIADLADDSVLTSAFYSTYIRDQVVVQCTSSTRPAAVEGRVVAETDTDRLARYASGAWVYVDATPWTAYTPSWTNVTVGDGTHASTLYRYVGGSIEVCGQLTLGSTSAVSGEVSQTVPDSATISTLASMPNDLTLFDIGTDRFKGTVFPSSSTQVVFARIVTSSNDMKAGALSATSPFTWAATDIIAWHYSAVLA